MINHKLPPHSVESEQAVLGALILDNSLFPELSAIVQLEDFYRMDHQIIFGAISDLANRHIAATFITLMEHMKKNGSLEDAGGLPYLGTLANDTPGTANVVAYANLIREKSQLRSLICICGDAIEKAFKGEDVSEAVSTLGKASTAILERTSGGAVTFSDAIDASVQDYLAAVDERKFGRTPGIPFGIPYLDTHIGGMRKGETIGIAARTSVGKSTCGNQVALYAASRGFSGVYFSLEENPSNFATRAIARKSSLNLGKIRAGSIDIENLFMDSVNHPDFRGLPLHIESKTFDLTGIVAKIIFFVRKHKVKFAVIDHIGLVKSSAGKNSKRHEDVGLVSRTLKQLAASLDISIIELIQVGRESEKENRYPRLSDLRESGDIEQDLNVCIAMHPIGEVDDKGDQPMALGILKNRFGRRGWAKDRQFVFRGRWQRVDEIEELDEAMDG